jgi:Arf-GAP/SH3 domain/ANK repeat/PH domain-containing protein
MSLTVPQRVRIPSTQSIDSRLSDSEGELWAREPPSPIDVIATIPEYEFAHSLGVESSPSNNPIVLNCERPGEDLSLLSDGPLFRSTLRQMQLKTLNMRTTIKKVLKKAEAAKESQIMCNAAIAAFMEALREASSSNANAVQPALDHYFEKIAAEILSYERQNTTNLQRLIIDPLSKLYSNDIKQVESKKKDFDEETKEFYSYVSRYLGKREDSMKDKKRAEVDSKYETKRRTFELKRFEYSSFMQDLHGGRKDQEVLSQLTKYADAQAKGFLNTSRKVEIMLPQLEALCHEVGETNKEYALLKTAREEKRRALETSHKSLAEGEAAPRESMALPHAPGQVATLNEQSFCATSCAGKAQIVWTTIRSHGRRTGSQLITSNTFRHIQHKSRT